MAGVRYDYVSRWLTPLVRNGLVAKFISASHPFEKARQYACLGATYMKILDSKRIAFALFLLPGVGAFAQTSTQGLLAVVGAAGPTLASDLVNAATGALSQAQVINEAQVVGGAFTHVTAHPTGRFVYAVGLFINGYMIDAGDGALTPVPGSPFQVPASAQSGGVAVEASGRFLYVGLIPPQFRSPVIASIGDGSVDGHCRFALCSQKRIRAGVSQRRSPEVSLCRGKRGVGSGD